MHSELSVFFFDEYRIHTVWISAAGTTHHVSDRVTVAVADERDYRSADGLDSNRVVARLKDTVAPDDLVCQRELTYVRWELPLGSCCADKGEARE